MNREYRTEDWDRYRMNYQDPFRVLEPSEAEISAVEGALGYLRDLGILPRTGYDEKLFLAHRKTVAEQFEIPWTAISPRMQRLLYAINAIHRPSRMVAAGIFCGNTFISNAGAAVGPGSCSTAEDLVGVEIQPEEAARAERNVRKIDPTGVARIVAADAVTFVRDYPHEIDLLYLDANGTNERGKGIYLDILEKALPKMIPGSIVLAHNSENGGPQLDSYLAYVRGSGAMRESLNVVLDPEGLEVSMV